MVSEWLLQLSLIFANTFILLFITIQMNFPNTGMLNTVSKRLATSSVPGILNASGTGISNQYMYDQAIGNAYVTDVDKQIQFDNQVNNMLFGGSNDGRYIRLLNGDNVIDRQVKGISTVTNRPQSNREAVMQSMGNQLSQTAQIARIADEQEILQQQQQAMIQQQQQQVVNDGAPTALRSPEPFTMSMAGVFPTFSGTVVVALITAFVLYLMVQMYISQKKLEMMMTVRMKEINSGGFVPFYRSG